MGYNENIKIYDPEKHKTWTCLHASNIKQLKLYWDTCTGTQQNIL